MRTKLPSDEAFVNRDGVKIHFEIYGSGAETILFIPPWSIVHSRVYKAQVPFFAENFRCVTYDPRGNGKSDRPNDASAYTLDQFLGDAIAVLDAVGVDRAILIGLSFGGMLASLAAAQHPDRVQAAVLIGTAAAIGPGYPYMMPQHFLTQQQQFTDWNKYNREYWLTNYREFAEFFMSNMFVEPHSTKQIEDSVGWACETDGHVLGKTVEARTIAPPFDVGEAMYRAIRCPVLVIHGDNDRIQPYERAQRVAEVLGVELKTIPGGGHNPSGRFPAKCNAMIIEFLQELGLMARPQRKTRRARTALYLSSPIGLGHARRDLAIARELRDLHPDLEIHWLAQDPVTRLLESRREIIHPMSKQLASETRHIEQEAGEHELHCFEALRRMDEVLIKNFMHFQQAVEETEYDLVIADEAWDIDHHWHEHPELKRSQLAWFTDFVGYLPMDNGDKREAFLTSDYNAEMIQHVEKNPAVRDRAIFVGTPDDVVPRSFGEGLPDIQSWVTRHFEFSGYIIGEHPNDFGSRDELRRSLGYNDDERVCIVTVGGSGVGAHLIRRVLQTYPLVVQTISNLRMIVVVGPRIDRGAFDVPQGVEIHSFVSDLDRHLAACDLAVVQGGLTTCMELTAAQTPFIYFPLKNHFEQNFHVPYRLHRYRAGRRMEFASSTPETIAEAMVQQLTKPGRFALVEAGGAARAARMLAELL
ncbi:alpha/beta hydrolase [Bradyrhizobium sp. CCBAU 53338]|uniref:alpha/beta hydrolase n=1 Tax=Bradyrhizobium sp. CCBAU 53338 TaxID=1325111 RepID=UPI00188AF336|nr:alpha/beta hydrolase [Bradyrhizobium sp. CCBAU 53338]QOZ51862.1 alpha/beta hydrolase [Bradyrhizobium sp. CCBAU 53338]